MKVGFSGSRYGMSPRQKSRLRLILSRIGSEKEIEQFHHGDCLGSDLQSHIIVCTDYGIPIWLHPPIKPNLRAWCEEALPLCVAGSCEPDEYLSRDRHIVDETDLLIGAPQGSGKSRRGGTWYTIEYADIRRGPRITLYTNGDMDFSAKADALYGNLFHDA